LVEILIVISILLVLFSVVVVTGKMTRDSTKRSTAQRQLAQVAAAINQFASFWPGWRWGNVIGGVLTADKGWPQFIPSQIFGAGYTVQTGFNDYTDLTTPPATWLSPGNTLSQKELNSNECLVYALTSPTGSGPFFRPDAQDGMQPALAANGSALFYPTFALVSPAPGASVRQRFVDPWGHPLRYFWVYRDAGAYRGYLPVPKSPTTLPDSDFHVANGFVVESAGPDGKYGNVWQVTPTPSDIADAEDNLVISP